MEILSLVKDEVLKIDKQAEVILFGSRARGDFRQDSDWDFLILLEKPLNPQLKDLIRENLYKLELEHNAVISSLVHNKTDWEGRAVMPIFQIIEKEGIRA
ncbi:MAG: nucleotidyltransferase domain-containing protein [Saprospiraceae bacterium]|nr:nucleotidyltransferase domain-containing protein [Saprospiraceae bacterium]